MSGHELAIRPPADLELVLEPDRLSEDAAARVDAILSDELAANTKRSYRQALRLWCLWYSARYGAALPLPVPVAAVQQFVVDFTAHRAGDEWSHALPRAIDELLVELGAKARPGAWSLGTVLVRVSALASVHRWHGHASPTDDPEVARLLVGLRHQHRDAGIVERRAAALTLEDLRAMLDACGEDLVGIRDRALIAFAFATGGRRRAEVAAALVEELEQRPDGSYLYELRRSKTSRGGVRRAEDWKPVAGRAALELARWLEASGVRDGALFRRVVRGRVGGPLGGEAVRRIVMQRAREAGVRGKVTAHSIRAGFVTEAIRAERPLLEVMAMTGHRSVQTVKRYHRPDTLEGNGSARLLD